MVRLVGLLSEYGGLCRQPLELLFKPIAPFYFEAIGQALGFLSALPGLLAGSACCGPIILPVWGIQASASLIGLFGWLVPVAVALLLATLIINGRRTKTNTD